MYEDTISQPYQPKTVAIPSLIDLHVHVREPGHEHKETYKTCFQAAVATGITTICAMPNTSPELTDEKSYQLINSIAQKAAKAYALANPTNPKVNYFLYQAATHPPTPILNHKNICGLKMYLNCTTGNLLIKDPATIEHYFKIPETKNRPIMCHAEIDILPTILQLSAKYKQRTHICHVARKSEMELIAVAKKTNDLLTCEVSPHHLLLTLSSDPLFNVKPNLQTSTDIKTLWEHLPTTIDCIATDHAPHLYEEKQTLGSFGFTGLETLLPVMLQQVKEKRLTLERLVELTYTNPLKLLSPSSTHSYPHSTITIKNPHHPETESVKYKGNTHSKSKWSPFIGHLVIKDPIIKYTPESI